MLVGKEPPLPPAGPCFYPHDVSPVETAWHSDLRAIPSISHAGEPTRQKGCPFTFGLRLPTRAGCTKAHPAANAIRGRCRVYCSRDAAQQVELRRGAPTDTTSAVTMRLGPAGNGGMRLLTFLQTWMFCSCCQTSPTASASHPQLGRGFSPRQGGAVGRAVPVALMWVWGRNRVYSAEARVVDTMEWKRRPSVAVSELVREKVKSLV